MRSMLWLLAKSAVLWFIVGVVTIYIIKGTSIGEVIFTISASRGWGVHIFDLFVFPIGAAALGITWFWYRKFLKKEKNES